MRGIERPIIFLSGRGTVPAIVEAMKAGTVDFLSKPCLGDELLDAIKVAEERDRVRLQRAAERKAASNLIDKLTRREKEVMELVVRGDANKNIAALLGTTERTIKEHRGRVMRKMGIRSVAELVRLASKGIYRAAIAKRHGSCLKLAPKQATCPLLAQSGHRLVRCTCPLSGGKADVDRHVIA